MKIKISVKTLNSHKIYKIDDEERVFTINNKKINTSIERTVFFITQITTDWPDKMLNNNIVDGIEVKISLKSDYLNRTLRFKNSFPKDFYTLINYLDEVEND